MKALVVLSLVSLAGAQLLDVLPVLKDTVTWPKFGSQSLNRPPTGTPLGKSLYYCGNDQDLVTIESVRLNPDPPHKGQKLFIEGSGHVNQRVVNGSYIDVSVKYGLIKLLTRRFDLCDLVGEIGLKCPIEEGDIRFSKEVDIPKEIPPGIYTVNAIARLPDTKDSQTKSQGDQLTCLNAYVRF